MLTKRIIPCLDCRDGRVVKGVQFQDLRDAGSPVKLAQRYQAEGADELVVLDVAATVEGRNHQIETTEAIRRELSIPLTVGGGVRGADDVARLLASGADKVAINSAAVQHPELIEQLAAQFGAQCTVVAVDAAAQNTRWQVVIRSGRTPTKRDVVEWCREAAERGAGEILLTSWDRDGTKSGYALDLIQAVCNAVNIPVIASGGASEPRHLYEAFRAGADAVLAASIFHWREYSVSAVKDFLHQHGIEIRPC
jgi:imidazoleglycerol phosphate synthase cyclase subunit